MRDFRTKPPLDMFLDSAIILGIALIFTQLLKNLSNNNNSKTETFCATEIADYLSLHC